MIKCSYSRTLIRSYDTLVIWPSDHRVCVVSFDLFGNLPEGEDGWAEQEAKARRLTSAVGKLCKFIKRTSGEGFVEVPRCVASQKNLRRGILEKFPDWRCISLRGCLGLHADHEEQLRCRDVRRYITNIVGLDRAFGVGDPSLECKHRLSESATPSPNSPGWELFQLLSPWPIDWNWQRLLSRKECVKRSICKPSQACSKVNHELLEEFVVVMSS